MAVRKTPVLKLDHQIDLPATSFRANLLGPNPDPAPVASLSNETQVTADPPPTYITRAANDKSVSAPNSALMYAALQKAGVPSEFKEYPTGAHGFGFGRKPDPSPPGWLDAAAQWLQGEHLLTLTPPVGTAAPPGVAAP